MAMNLLDILSPESIKIPLAATDRQAAIDELIDLLAEQSLIHDPQKLKQVVWEREQQRSTGIGEGIAIPHGKSECSENLVMAIGRPKGAIDFHSVDRKPVKLIFLLASPPEKTSDHIQALGKISRIMVDADFRERAYVVDDAETLYEMIREAESAASRPGR